MRPAGDDRCIHASNRGVVYLQTRQRRSQNIDSEPPQSGESRSTRVISKVCDDNISRPAQRPAAARRAGRHVLGHEITRRK